MIIKKILHQGGITQYRSYRLSISPRFFKWQTFASTGAQKRDRNLNRRSAWGRQRWPRWTWKINNLLHPHCVTSLWLGGSPLCTASLPGSRGVHHGFQDALFGVCMGGFVFICCPNDARHSTEHTQVKNRPHVTQTQSPHRNRKMYITKYECRLWTVPKWTSLISIMRSHNNPKVYSFRNFCVIARSSTLYPF